jgi:uncharacterized protein
VGPLLLLRSRRAVSLLSPSKLGSATESRGPCAGFGLNQVMASGYVGVLTCELHFPEAHSLKEKRHYVRSAKAQLQNRVGASVAEVDHHEVWQRARLTVACVAREHHELERLLDEAERWLRGQEWEVAIVDRFVVDPDDE